MVARIQIRFPLGQVVSTPGALEALERAGQTPAEFLNRHAQGDFGELDEEDLEANHQALQDGSRLLSVYRLNKTGEKLWIITEAQDEDGRRASTCLLLPEEY